MTAENLRDRSDVERQRMKKTIERLVAILHLLAFELLSQVSVQWRESIGEKWGQVLFLVTVPSLVWGVLPAFASVRL